MTHRLLLLTAILLAATPAHACLWDYDTLQMERERFPGVLEVMVGKFLRHSDEWYEWRIEDRQEKLAKVEAGELELTKEEQARLYDDWAVALSKLGRDDEAIAVIDKKAAAFPETGQYETHANRGTFLIHAGRLEEGIAEIDKALAINPDAHFGREKYQKLLVEYVLSKRELKTEWDQSTPFHKEYFSFSKFIEEQDDADYESAIQGIVGMMRFGEYRSPVLLDALGDLLRFRLYGENENDLSNDAKMLAARSYLLAAQYSDSEEKQQFWREAADDAVFYQSIGDGQNKRIPLADIELQLTRELEEAERWFEGVRKAELFWINNADDPDAAYWKKYGGQEIKVGHAFPRLKDHYTDEGIPKPLIAATIFGVLTTIAAVALIITLHQRKIARTENPDSSK
ncbi:hypothetical protein [Calycomorphotria hydatis]|uniref:Tetratricopeptide repeat protein n=1 Tax=Calycomorphotria hydatis TaxID=2528027 RepID=A0A517T3J7_9PLAN|nr:hypothetical protein [Calycomorphotria hydatis]QDT62950.1 Tetratricopeptide repeat protein [Calycomorphotria hydatis]